MIISLLLAGIIPAYADTGDTPAEETNANLTGPGLQSLSPSVPPENETTAETFGEINITTNPGGAEIYIQDKAWGKTPAIITGIPAGFYEIVLRREGYEDAYERILVRPGETIEISRGLSVKTRVISISTKPSGANVYLDGEFRGVTPIVFETEAGNHTLTVKKSGYGTIFREIGVSDEEPLVMEEKLHFNLLLSAGGILFFLFLVLFAKKHPEVLKVKLPTGSGTLKKYGPTGKREGKKREKSSRKEKEEPESEYLVDLEELQEPEFRYRKESKEDD